MVYERGHRAADPQLEHPPEEWKHPELDPEIPGKRTLCELVDQLVAVQHRLPISRGTAVPGRSAPMTLKLGVADFQALALRDVLSRLTHRSLRDETLAAADPHVAKRVRERWRGWSTSIDQRSTQQGLAMWRAAERRAVTLYRRALATGMAVQETSAVTAALDAIGRGSPLDPHVCRKMERILGVRLDRVRLHTGAVAQEAAAAANARAFTVGEDVFFPGYDPRSAECEETLLHELVHCRQWWQGRIGPSAGGVVVSEMSHPLEQEAETVVAQALHGPARAHDRSGREPPSAADPRFGLPLAMPVASTQLSGVSARGAMPHMILRKASAGGPGKAVAEPESAPARNSAAPDVATTNAADAAVSLTITPGWALAMELPNYGEAAVRVTGAGRETYRYMVLVPTELRGHADAARLFSSLKPVPAEIVGQLTSALQEQAGLSGDTEATPDVVAFWLPRTKDGAKLYFNAPGVYMVVALADHPNGLSVWKPFVVRSHERNEFEKGVIRGIYSTGALFASGAAAMARGVGAGTASEYLIKDIQQTLQKEAEAEERRADVPTIREALTGPGPFLKYVAAALGEQIPTIITMIVGGGVGRIFAGAVAKTGARYGGRSLGEHQATQLAVEASAKWKLRGTFLGAFGANAELQTGEIYERLLEIQGLDESQKAVLAALLGGVVGGFLETLVPFYLARMLGLGGPFIVALTKQIAARPNLASQVIRAAGVAGVAGAVKGAATVGAAAAAEGLTEVLQGEVANAAESVFNKHFRYASPEVIAEREENFARAAVAGFVLIGGVHAGQALTAKPSDKQAATTPARAPAPDDQTVLDTVRNSEGIYEVTPAASDHTNQPPSSSSNGDVLRYNAQTGYYESATTKHNSSIRSGAEIIGYNRTTHQIAFEDGGQMDARYVTARIGDEDFTVVDIRQASTTSELMGTFRRIGSNAHDLIAAGLATVTLIAPLAGGGPVGGKDGNRILRAPASVEPGRSVSREPKFPLSFKTDNGVSLRFEKEERRRLDLYVDEPGNRLNFIGFVNFDIQESTGQNTLEISEIRVRDEYKKKGVSPELLVQTIANSYGVPIQKSVSTTTEKENGPQKKALHKVRIWGRFVWISIKPIHLKVLNEMLESDSKSISSSTIRALYEPVWKNDHPDRPMPRGGYAIAVVDRINHALAHATEDPSGVGDHEVVAIILPYKEESTDRQVEYVYKLFQPGTPAPRLSRNRRTLPKLVRKTYTIGGHPVSLRLRPLQQKVFERLLENYVASGQNDPTAGFVSADEISALIQSEQESYSRNDKARGFDLLRGLWQHLRELKIGTIEYDRRYGYRFVELPERLRRKDQSSTSDPQRSIRLGDRTIRSGRISPMIWELLELFSRACNEDRVGEFSGYVPFEDIDALLVKWKSNIPRKKATELVSIILRSRNVGHIHYVSIGNRKGLRLRLSGDSDGKIWRQVTLGGVRVWLHIMPKHLEALTLLLEKGDISRSDIVDRLQQKWNSGTQDQALTNEHVRYYLPAVDEALHHAALRESDTEGTTKGPVHVASIVLKGTKKARGKVEKVYGIEFTQALLLPVPVIDDAPRLNIQTWDDYQMDGDLVPAFLGPISGAVLKLLAARRTIDLAAGKQHEVGFVEAGAILELARSVWRSLDPKTRDKEPTEVWRVIFYLNQSIRKQGLHPILYDHEKRMYYLQPGGQ